MKEQLDVRSERDLTFCIGSGCLLSKAFSLLKPNMTLPDAKDLCVKNLLIEKVEESVEGGLVYECTLGKQTQGKRCGRVILNERSFL